MVPTYDAELNLLYVGTSVTAPAPKFLLAGNDHQYLYHNSTLALNADTGKIVWYYQHLVDHWDFDHPFERLLVDTAVAPSRADVSWINPRIKAGERRKVLTGIPGKTGIVYTLDRQTGEFLWAKPDSHAERRFEYRRRDGPRHRQSRDALYGDRTTALRLPYREWRKKLPGGRRITRSQT
jgi:alcohol dehydrogenase (cytochrome c)